MAQATETARALSSELVTYLQSPRPVLVTTLDADSGWPTNNLISWVLAKNSHTVRLVADDDGRVLDNIRADSRVLLTVMAHGSCHVIEGEARVILEQIEGMNPKMGVAELSVRTVRDVLFFGGRLTVEPKFEVTYDRNLKERLDNTVFEAMRSL